jgi:hypothetical protein
MVLKTRLAGISSFLFLLSVMTWTGCEAPADRSVPLHLIGTWETSDRRYEGCLLEITSEQIVFQNPATGMTINFIRGIRTTPVGQKSLYDILYHDREGAEFTLSLYYSRVREQDVIHFKHQSEMQWKRKGFAWDWK